MVDVFANLKTAGPARRRAKKGDTRKSLARLSAFALLLLWLRGDLRAVSSGEIYDLLPGFREQGKSDPRAVGDACGAAAGGLDLERDAAGAYPVAWQNGAKCLRALRQSVGQLDELATVTGKTVEQIVEIVNAWPDANVIL